VERLRVIESVAQAYRSARERVGPGTIGHIGSIPAADTLFEWGQLQVLERLGEGAYGEVYSAWDPVLERRVALKLRCAGPGRLGGRDFIQEARRLARVRHHNVLTVHGADIHDGRVGLWTDLVRGRTLEERLEREGTLGSREAALIGVDLCCALAAVHAAGLVHGDVKASNVMRERGGRIVLMDFGTSEAPAERAPGAVTPWACGTPLVMAPELLLGDAPDAASDLYSLGVLLYRMTSGRYPVEGEGLAELCAAHERGERKSLRDVRADLEPRFVQLVERAMAHERRARYTSAGEFERDLAEVLATGCRTAA